MLDGLADVMLPVFLSNDQPPECPVCGRRPRVVSGHGTNVWTMHCRPCGFRYLLEDDGEPH